jgi:hypothetical protein
LEKMRLAFRDRRLKVAGISGMLREDSTSLDGLEVEVAQEFRSREPVGALV